MMREERVPEDECNKGVWEERLVIDNVCRGIIRK